MTTSISLILMSFLSDVPVLAQTGDQDSLKARSEFCKWLIMEHQSNGFDFQINVEVEYDKYLLWEENR